MSFLTVLRDVLSKPEETVHSKTFHGPAKPFAYNHDGGDDSDTSTEEEEDKRPIVHITVEDIRPDITALNSMTIALQDIATCKGMFDKWAQELDRAAPHKRDEEEDELFAAVDELRDEAALALDASGTILRDHETFAHEMTALLESSAAHPTGDFYRPMEVMAVGESIMKQSDLLSKHAGQMQSQLEYVLDIVDSIRRKRERRKLWRKVLKWLVKAFNVLAAVLTVGAFVLPILHPIGVVGSAAFGIGATLATLAASLCKDIQESHDDDRNFERMLDFLKYQVPVEAEKARRSLENFQAAHRILQVDVKIKNGECVRISKYDADKAREEWRAHRLSLSEVNVAFQRSRDGHDY